MDFSMDLESLNEVQVVEETVYNVEVASEKSIVPKVGAFLGLDISESSSGICIYYNGTKFVSNISLNLYENSVFRETLLRRKLKKELVEVAKIVTTDFDMIMVEDAFQGPNPNTTRLLYGINTAIDELILDGVFTCKDFLRVSNKSWKTWLFSIDTEGKTKGYNDKLKIEKCLEMLGVIEEGKGYQDRLDSCGMLLGYFLCQGKAKKQVQEKRKKRVTLSDILVAYQEDLDLAVHSIWQGGEDTEKMLLSETRWSKSKIIQYLTDDPTQLYVTENVVWLGKLADELDLPFIAEGGYLAFCLKKNRVQKYIGNLEVDKDD